MNLNQTLESNRELDTDSHCYIIVLKTIIKY